MVLAAFRRPLLLWLQAVRLLTAGQLHQLLVCIQSVQLLAAVLLVQLLVCLQAVQLLAAVQLLRWLQAALVVLQGLLGGPPLRLLVRLALVVRARLRPLTRLAFEGATSENVPTDWPTTIAVSKTFASLVLMVLVQAPFHPVKAFADLVEAVLVVNCERRKCLHNLEVMLLPPLHDVIVLLCTLFLAGGEVGTDLEVALLLQITALLLEGQLF
jgi:hypothetical protein